ncbi:methylenetetrahydrofolate reductase [Zhengella mangrovi]|uniref:Methylenetetrahydrofolate reductase n=1 Tax=Zhengella mangrovi TaxID=1982044 RepID=A0A2G1QPP6_9HYPH|nr:methylenetetrahydrofolate reductase C-terminal domain-containing protein [Zhengella mangrovi]PHP67506.1 methylenetetrahydrofolate reductase [Zhengella mangrovi]
MAAEPAAGAATAKPKAGKKPATAYVPAGVSPVSRARKAYTIRLWSVRHARFLEWVYARFSGMFLTLHPLWNAVGYQRAEAPVKFVEKRVKGLLFDCRMCGQCILSSTGMSCPMNCPKQLRNGPCGGVRANGHCEVEPDMPCVWVQAWKGTEPMREGRTNIMNVQKPVDQSLRETSAWLRVTANAAAGKEAARNPAQ